MEIITDLLAVGRELFENSHSVNIRKKKSNKDISKYIRETLAGISKIHKQFVGVRTAYTVVCMYSGF